jgi:hypothetical protein
VPATTPIESAAARRTPWPWLKLPRTMWVTVPADRSQRLRRFVRVEQQQNRGQDEVTASADQRPERADAQTERRQQDRCLGRERQGENVAAPAPIHFSSAVTDRRC